MRVHVAEFVNNRGKRNNVGAGKALFEKLCSVYGYSLLVTLAVVIFVVGLAAAPYTQWQSTDPIGGEEIFSDQPTVNV